MRTKNSHHGFTIIELMLSLALMTILAALTIPLFGNNDDLQIDIAKRLLVSDLEYAQILAITNTQEEIALIVDGSNGGWHIASLDNPSVPLEDSVTGEPLVTTFGLGPAASAGNVTIESNMPGNMVAFNQNGGLIDFTQIAVMTLRCGESTSEIQVTPMTGSIR